MGTTLVCTLRFSKLRAPSTSEAVKRQIHSLCSVRNPDNALPISLREYRPDSLNLSSVIYALCDAAKRFEEAHRRCLISS
ncbi:hypothetical protein Bca4012_035166 [Brassica carinata]